MKKISIFAAALLSLSVPAIALAFTPVLQTSGTGYNWTEYPNTSSNTQGYLAVTMSSDGKRIVAANEFQTVRVSQDGGSSWTTYPLKDSSRTMVSSSDGMRVVGFDPYKDAIVISTDGGHTWRSAAAPFTSIDSMSASADGMKIVAVNNSADIYVSTDGGVTWVKKWSVSPHALRIGVGISGDGSRIVAAVDGGYLMISTDGGTTWTKQTALGVQYWYETALSNDGKTIFVTISPAVNGKPDVYVSQDGGSNWSSGYLPVSGGLIHAAVSGDGTHFAATDLENIYVSSDHGATWIEQMTGSGITRAWDGVALSYDGSKIAAVDEIRSIFVGTTGTLNDVLTGPPTGGSWSRVPTPGAISGISVSPDGTQITVLAGPSAQIYTSKDLGVSWKSVPKGTLEMAESADGKTIIVDGVSAPVISHDSGATWQIVPVGAQVYSAAMSASGSYIYFGSRDGLYKSSDSGATWSQPTMPIPGDDLMSTDDGYDASQADYHFFDWMSTSADGKSVVVYSAYGLYVSTDAGATWKLVPYTGPGAIPVAVYHPTFSGDGKKIFGYTYDGQSIAVSSDYGVTWKSMQPAPNLTISSFAVSYDGSVITVTARFGNIYSSSDGGATWVLQSAAKSGDWYYAASSADGSKAYAATLTGAFLAIGSLPPASSSTVSVVQTSSVTSGTTAIPKLPPPTATLTQSAATTYDVLGILQSFTFSWSSTNADSCSVRRVNPAGTNVLMSTALSGSRSLTLAQLGTHHLWIDCTGPSGSVHQDLYHSVVYTTTDPTVKMTASSSPATSVTQTAAPAAQQTSSPTQQSSTPTNTAAPQSSQTTTQSTVPSTQTTQQVVPAPQPTTTATLPVPASTSASAAASAPTNSTLDRYTVTPAVACLSGSTTANVISVQAPYALPAGSVITVSDSPTYANGYYWATMSGLTTTQAAAGFLPNNAVPNMPPAITFTPGTAYYVTIYDATLKYGSEKHFSIPACPAGKVSSAGSPSESGMLSQLAAAVEAIQAILSSLR